MSTDSYDGVYQEDLMVGVDTGVTDAPAGGTEAVTQIGVHSLGIGQAKVTAAWVPGEVPSGGKVSTTVAVVGATLGDFVLCSFSLDLQELQLTADVVSSGVVEVVLGNLTGSAVDPGSGTLAVLVLKSR